MPWYIYIFIIAAIALVIIAILRKRQAKAYVTEMIANFEEQCLSVKNILDYEGSIDPEEKLIARIAKQFNEGSTSLKDTLFKLSLLQSFFSEISTELIKELTLLHTDDEYLLAADRMASQSLLKILSVRMAQEPAASGLLKMLFLRGHLAVTLAQCPEGTSAKKVYHHCIVSKAELSIYQAFM